jgi:hypothetical protein
MGLRSIHGHRSATDVPTAAPDVRREGERGYGYRDRDSPFGAPAQRGATNALGSCLGYDREIARREMDAILGQGSHRVARQFIRCQLIPS